MDDSRSGAGHDASGDAHALPLATASADRVKLDRVLMHVASPSRVLAEVHRVLRADGLVALAEPDWDTLVVDDPDVETSRAYTRFFTAIGQATATNRATAGR